MKKIVYVAFITFFLSQKCLAQSTELFPGESKFESCKMQTPISQFYNVKDKNAFIQKAMTYKDVELVLLSYNKRTKTATYTPYYLVVEENLNRYNVYLETPADHQKKGGRKQASFLTDNPKIQRFYVSDCFLKILAENPELKEIIKQ